MPSALPQLVTTDAEGFKAVDYGKLPLLAIQAIKELAEQNAALLPSGPGRSSGAWPGLKRVPSRGHQF